MHEGRWLDGGPARLDQRTTHLGESSGGHEHHQGVHRRGHTVKLHGLPSRPAGGDDGDAGREAAMGHRNAGECRRCEGRADTRHDLEGHVRSGACKRLLAPSSEDEGIAPLQPDDLFALSGSLHQEIVDVFLVDGGLSGGLSGVDALGRRGREVEHLAGDQPVVHDHVGPPEGVRPSQGEEAGVPGTRSYQEDSSGHAAPLPSSRPTSKARASLCRPCPISSNRTSTSRASRHLRARSP